MCSVKSHNFVQPRQWFHVGNGCTEKWLKGWIWYYIYFTTIKNMQVNGGTKSRLWVWGEAGFLMSITFVPFLRGATQSWSWGQVTLLKAELRGLSVKVVNVKIGLPAGSCPNPLFFLHVKRTLPSCPSSQAAWNDSWFCISLQGW